MKDTTTRMAKPIFENVKDAPFRIGDFVKVIQIVDSTGEQKLLGKTGTVEFFEYSCGCGQSYPKNPMIGVRIAKATHEFWKEELFLILRSRKRIS